MQREILSEVFENADITVVGVVSSLEEIERIVQTRGADVMIVGLVDESIPRACRAMAIDNPSIRIVGIGRSGRRSVLQEVFVRTRELGEVSPSALALEIRDVVHSCAVAP
jgi:hypothetical protein